MVMLQQLIRFKIVRTESVLSGSHHNCLFKSQLVTIAKAIHHLPLRGSAAICDPTKMFRLC